MTRIRSRTGYSPAWPRSCFTGITTQKDGRCIQTETTDTTIAGHFPELVDQHPASAMQRRAVDVALILHTERGLNTSTFAAPLAASTGSDFHCAITSAISALHGPAQGGAQEETMRLIAGFASPAEAEHGIMQMLARKQRIAGFGHEIDSRTEILRRWSQKLGESAGDQRVYQVSAHIEQIMCRQAQLHPGLDCQSASVYHFCGIPASLFASQSVIAQLSGSRRISWSRVRKIARYT
ncbi:MAG: citrate/2-methylcitrate synthase [Acidiferrobacterales bacterium]